MDKYDYSQLELFSQDQGPAPLRQAMPGSLRSYIKAYEKAVMALIGALVVAVAAFSLGVEKGKKLAPAQGAVRMSPVAAQEAVPQALPAPKPLVAPQSVLVKKALPPAPAPAVKAAAAVTAAVDKAKQPYTIQIGSFSEKAYAKREADLLKKKGYQTNMVTRGKYVILCVGAYPDKNTALTQLTKLQKQYQGCFIRRL